MLDYPLPEKPWERIHLDTLEQPLSENEFKYLLVIIDYFSRYCILQPIQNKKAETVATTIFEKAIYPYTTPKTIIADNGPEFNNAILKNMCFEHKLIHPRVKRHIILFLVKIRIYRTHFSSQNCVKSITMMISY